MYEIHIGSGFRLNDTPSIRLSSVGQCLMFVFGSTSGFSFALTVCELIALFFVSSQYVYTFDCLPVDKSQRELNIFSGLTTAASRAKIRQ